MVKNIDVQHKDFFRLYILAFCVVVAIERYFLYESYGLCRETVYPFFYSTNLIRLLFVFVPFGFFLFGSKKIPVTHKVISTAPFLLSAIGFIAVPKFQFVYFLMALFSCFFVKGLRIFALASFVLLFLFFYFVFPNFTSLRDCSKTSSIKANMHTFQTALETYAADHDIYPESMKKLEKVARSGNYWKELKNPFTGEEGYGLSFSDISKEEVVSAVAKDSEATKPVIVEILGIRFTKGYNASPWSGQAIYQRLDKNRYAIYGGDYAGTRMLIFDRGVPFTLTNSY